MSTNPGDIPPNEDFDTTALFSDRLSSKNNVQRFRDKNFEGSMKSYVYPEDLRSTEFARRGGQVLHFSIFTRKSQSFDLSQTVGDFGRIASQGAKVAASVAANAIATSEYNPFSEYTADDPLFDEVSIGQNRQAAADAAGRQAGQNQVDLVNLKNFVLGDNPDADDARLASFIQSQEQARFGFASEKLEDEVMLYVPKGLEFDNTVEYDEASLAGLSALTQFIASGFSDTAAISTNLALKALKLGSVAGKAIGLDVEGGLRARAGFSENPKNEMIFKGPKRGSFSFEFEFAPRTKKEADTALEIIEVFRYYMSPEVSLSTSILFAPQEFEITVVNLNSKFTENGETFGSEVNTTMPKIGRCYLSNVKVNYTPDDRSAFFQNGQATRILLSLKFDQINFITKQGILDGF
jgi:hypothetical protein